MAGSGRKKYPRHRGLGSSFTDLLVCHQKSSTVMTNDHQLTIRLQMITGRRFINLTEERNLVFRGFHGSSTPITTWWCLGSMFECWEQVGRGSILCPAEFLIDQSDSQWIYCPCFDVEESKCEWPTERMQDEETLAILILFLVTLGDYCVSSFYSLYELSKNLKKISHETRQR